MRTFAIAVAVTAAALLAMSAASTDILAQGVVIQTPGVDVRVNSRDAHRRHESRNRARVVHDRSESRRRDRMGGGGGRGKPSK